jgi:hypothetical protein
MPLAAIAFALFCYIMFSYIKINNPSNLAGKIMLGIIIIAIIWTGVAQSSLPVTSEKIRQAKDFLVFKGCLLSLRARAGAKDEIGVNYFRYPFIRYYTGRHCAAVFDKPSLLELPKLPEYFIFIPYNNQAAAELLQFLNQKYVILFKCDSVRFPALFLKLKGPG